MKKLLLIGVFIVSTLATSAQSLSYSSSSGGLSENVTSNNGTIEGDITITIAGATFSNPAGNLSDNDFSINNLPIGITESLDISADGTTATLILTGQASSHQASNNVNDLIFTFKNSAFVGFTADQVTNAVSAASGISLEFTDNPSLSYSGSDFLEVPENNGAVTGSLTITNTGGSFINPSGTITSPEHFTISNLPAGFNAQASVSPDGEIVIITLIGEAEENQESDNVAGLIFTFNDDAFSGGILASTVFNSTNRNSGVGVDFNDNPILSYSSTPSIESPGNIKDATPTGDELVIGQLPSFYMSNDGETFLVASDFTISWYSLSTPFNIETAEFQDQISGSGTLKEIDFSQDELTLFVMNASGSINRYILTNPLDISAVDLNNPSLEPQNWLQPTANEFFSQLSRGEFQTSSGGFSVDCFSLNDDGSKLYAGFNRGGIMQFNLSENYNLSEPQLEVFGFGFAIEFIEFSAGGERLYLGSADSVIYQFTLDVPFDITSSNHNRVDRLLSESRTLEMEFLEGDGKFLLNKSVSQMAEYEFLADGFVEMETNDGSVDGTLDIEISNAVFSNPDGQLSIDTDYSISNLPEGLISNLTVAADGRSARLTLSGNADSNERAHDVDGLIFDFQNSSFNSLVDVADFIDASSFDSEIPVRFGLDNDQFPQAIISSPTTSGESESTFPITVTFSEPVSGFSEEDIIIDPIENTGSFDGVIENFVANGDNTVFTFDFKTLSFLDSDASVIYGLRLFNFSTFNASGNGNVAGDTLIIKTGIFSNEAPIIEVPMFEVEEFADPGTLVGKISVSDPEGDSFTLTVRDDPDDDYNVWDAFSFIDETGEIFVFDSEELDLQLRNSFSFIAEADDGRLTSVKGTITLIPAEDEPLGLTGNSGNFELFPNPTSDLITVSFMNDHKPIKYRLVNLEGKELITGKQISTSSFDIDLRSLPIGVFILQVTHEDGSVTGHKILKD